MIEPPNSAYQCLRAALRRRANVFDKRISTGGASIVSEDIKALVRKAYKKKYPTFAELLINPIDNTFGGQLVAVEYTEEPENEKEERPFSSEVCFVDHRDQVRIFDTTLELVYFLSDKANEKFIDKIFRKDIFSSLIFLVLLLAVLISGVVGGFAPSSLDIIKNLTVLAAGYFFGTHNWKKD